MCNQSEQYLQNYGTQNYIGHNGVGVLNHADCEGITINLLQMYLRLIVCVKSNTLYTNVSVTPVEIEAAKSLLDDWIIKKQTDPATCEYQEKLPLLQEIINRIVIFGRC